MNMNENGYTYFVMVYAFIMKSIETICMKQIDKVGL